MFSDVFQVRILVLMERAVKEKLLIEFFCKAMSIKRNKLQT